MIASAEILWTKQKRTNDFLKKRTMLSRQQPPHTKKGDYEVENRVDLQPAKNNTFD
jgi:hypothetical protein